MFFLKILVLFMEKLRFSLGIQWKHGYSILYSHCMPNLHGKFNDKKAEIYHITAGECYGMHITAFFRWLNYDFITNRQCSWCSLSISVICRRGKGRGLDSRLARILVSAIYVSGVHCRRRVDIGTPLITERWRNGCWKFGLGDGLASPVSSTLIIEYPNYTRYNAQLYDYWYKNERDFKTR